MQIELEPENVEAWNLYWDMKRLGQLGLDLRSMALSEEEADVLLLKLRQIDETMQQIEAESLKRAQEESKRGGYRGR